MSRMRLEIWEGGRLKDGRWRVEVRSLVLRARLSDGTSIFLRDALPRSDKQALLHAARVAHALGLSTVTWRNIGNRNTRYVEGVRFDPYKHERPG